MRVFHDAKGKFMLLVAEGQDEWKKLKDSLEPEKNEQHEAPIHEAPIPPGDYTLSAPDRDGWSTVLDEGPHKGRKINAFKARIGVVTRAMNMADKTGDLQNAEFGALILLNQAYLELCRVPVVDDSYPEAHHVYENALKTFLEACAHNGRV